MVKLVNFDRKWLGSSGAVAAKGVDTKMAPPSALAPARREMFRKTQPRMTTRDWAMRSAPPVLTKVASLCVMSMEPRTANSPPSRVVMFVNCTRVAYSSLKCVR
eukprot:1789368-Prymnesium_polylepis.5